VPPVFVQMDNGGEFAYINVICVAMTGCTVVRSIPNVPQSNAMVESIGTLKRLLAKLIHIRHAGLVGISMTNLYHCRCTKQSSDVEQWILSLDKALRIYNSTVHTSFGFKPVDAINVVAVTHAAYLAGLKTHGAAPGQVDLNLGDVVRLQIFKGRIAKYDKNNWPVGSAIHNYKQAERWECFETHKVQNHCHTPKSGCKPRNSGWCSTSSLVLQITLEPDTAVALFKFLTARYIKVVKLDIGAFYIYIFFAECPFLHLK